MDNEWGLPCGRALPLKALELSSQWPQASQAGEAAVPLAESSLLQGVEGPVAFVGRL